MTQFVQLTISGIALGCIYALIALGFVLVYKSTGVFNLAHGELVMLGAYVVFLLTTDRFELWFVLAVPIAAFLVAFFGAGIQSGVLQHLIGKPPFAVLMATIGVGLVIHSVVAAWFGFDGKSIDDPFGSRLLLLGEVRVTWVNVGTIMSTVVVVLLLALFFRRSRFGIAMRATALDQGAASALGVDVRVVFGLAWGLAGALATVAGVFLAGFPRSLDLSMGAIALLALPAVLLGGIDSIEGAVVGGVIIALIQVYAAGYQPTYAPWLGNNFHLVAPYFVLLATLLVRPYGLFGTKEVTRA